MYIKKKHPDVKVGIVCPDLPCEFGILPKNKFKAAIRCHHGKKLFKYTKYCDFFAILTEAMKHPLKIGERKYTVIEGICNGTAPENLQKCNNKAILYTGTLNRQFGILTLLEAFSLIEDPEAQLWICGSGDSKEAVEAAAEKDCRIKFFGYVTKDRASELQQKAFMLINPRQNEGEYTKYSFPSKTMEYMLNGKPVLMYRLDGIPAEYDPYLNYIEGNSAEDIKNAICKIFDADADEIALKAQSAARFVAENKNSAVQAKKILDLISELE
ncbi:MAG: glycosyltransferase [Acutalibacteraceae bacterium]|nr:glycosyltransferase [Acutalibacteraceae bacterium]